MHIINAGQNYGRQIPVSLLNFTNGKLRVVDKKKYYACILLTLYHIETDDGVDVKYTEKYVSGEKLS